MSTGKGNVRWAHVRTLARRFEDGRHVGPGEWLTVVKAANRHEQIFGAPESTGPWWAGGNVEEYPHARIIHRHDGDGEDDHTVSVVAKDEIGDRAIRAACEDLSIRLD